MKNKKINAFLFITALLINISCKNEINDKPFLEVYYLKQGIHFPMSINCNNINSPIFRKILKYKKITGDRFLNDFSKEIALLKKDEFQKSVDSRIKILFHHEKKVDTICMGEVFFISVNGELKKDAPALAKLIRDSIY
jgi:hypothetical protein